jgi:hypothetical protein
MKGMSARYREELPAYLIKRFLSLIFLTRVIGKSSRSKASLGRRWQTSPVTEESAEETVKTIAQGRLGLFR